MPKYTVKDKATGKTITFNWKMDTPPTDADMEEIFAAASPKPVEQSPGFVGGLSQEFGGTVPKFDIPDMRGTGGAIGAATGAALGAPLGIPGMAGGGVIGGAGGEAIEQLITRAIGKGGPKTAEEAVKRMNVQGAFGGAGEMVGPALKPVAMFGVKHAAKLKPVLEIGADVFSFGKRTASRFRDELVRQQNTLVEFSTERAKRMLESIGANIPKGEVGLKVGDAFQVLADEAQTLYRPYNDSVVRAAKDAGGYIEVPKVRKYLGELLSKKVKELPLQTQESVEAAKTALIREFGFTPNSTNGRILKQMMPGGKTGAKDIKTIFSTLWKDWKSGILDIEESNRNLFKSALLDDLNSIKSTVDGETISSLKIAADAITKKLGEIKKLSPTLKKFLAKSRGTGQPFYQDITLKPTGGERLVDALFRAQPEELMLIKNEIGDEMFDALQYNWVKDEIFSTTSGSFTKNANTGALQVRPAALADNIMEAESVIKRIDKVTGGDLWGVLKEEADYYRSVAPKFAKIEVSDSFDFSRAWDMMSDKTKQNLQTVSDAFAATGGVAARVAPRLNIGQ